MFQFADLERLPREPTGRVQREALTRLALPVPEDVLEQVCYDHGLDEHFQEQYGHLDLTRIRWRSLELTALDLSKASIHSEFLQWFAGVQARGSRAGEEGWKAIDPRRAVVEHWTRHRTWLRAPVLIEGTLVGRSSKLHLVEGHTRLGTLLGLVRAGVIAPESRHIAWVGTDHADDVSTNLSR